jgi:membrane protease YdiL (CAAX protease family)
MDQNMDKDKERVEAEMTESVTTGQVRESSPQRSWSRSPLLAWCEFGLIALIFRADIRDHIFLSKTLYLFPLAWVSLRVRGLRWRDVGLVRFQNWRKTLLIGVICGVAMELMELFISQPLLMRWTGKAPDLELFRALHGNVKWTLIAIAGSWTLAAFGEEMVYRGYLLNRIARVVRSARPAWIVGLIVSSCVFGAAHLGQGITGQLENALDGLLLGAMYLACGRNLAVPIVAHGISDTLDVLLMFAGLYPTLR